jgi:nitrite reductase/ring-hydroxylating ferredoxin subunit
MDSAFRSADEPEVNTSPALSENEFLVANLAPGQIGLVTVAGERVAVYNADGVFYASQDHCAHTGWPLSDGGELIGNQVTCPLHGWCYDVSTGEVVRGMRSLRLKTYRVVVDGTTARVQPDA